jgi:putative methyltransferase, YaeB/AF_0241 family
MNELTLRPIAYIHSDFATKFGIPRQPRLAVDLKATIVFEKEYQKDGALRQLDRFSHLWLIWGFSESFGRDWTPTVRPPRLGGEKRVGVFASRSPFRPNPIGLSAVKIEAIRKTANDGLVIDVIGADLKDGTPIYDIKPYLPYTDAIDASDGFAAKPELHSLEVQIAPELLKKIPAEKQKSLCEVLALDPRPAYQDDPQRIYGFVFAGLEIKFQVVQHLLTVTAVES